MSLNDLIGLLNLPHVLFGIVALVVIVAVYKLVSRSISRVTERLETGPHVENSFRLILRVASIVAVSTVFLNVFQLPTDWVVGASAVIGAAIGFGSSQTINNIVAGFYVIASRPFKVKDYIVMGDMEGQVEEISINYTKLYTPSFNLLEVPNTQVINSKILNCTHEGFIKYTFTLDLRHDMIPSNQEIIEKCIEPSIEQFHRKYPELQLRKPEFYFESSASFSRSFKFRIFIPRGEAKTLYTLRPELANMIINRWDELRKSD